MKKQATQKKWRLTQKHIQKLTPIAVIGSCILVIFLVGGIRLVMISIGVMTTFFIIVMACLYIYNKLPEE